MGACDSSDFVVYILPIKKILVIENLVLQTFDLGKRYKKRWAVRNLSLAVRRGEVFGFLGPNGAGKSTTIRMLLSLIVPTHGRVELFGEPLRQKRHNVLSRVGGLVERPDFYLYLSARRNLEIVAALMGGVAAQNIDQALDTVSLSGRASDNVKAYSHGMKQRLGIAQALLGNPEFIVLDEPTSGLDPQGIKEVRELIKHLSAERNMTVFLSSHLLSEIEQTATNMAIINNGELIVQGKVADLLNSGDDIVRIDARPIEPAVTLIEQQGFVKEVTRNQQLLDVKMPLEKISVLNELLVGGGIEIHALMPRRSLEEYFLAITEGASDVSHPR